MAGFSLEKYENRSVLQSNPLTEACKAMELYEGKLYYLALLEFNYRQDRIEKDIPLPELMIPTEVVLKVFGGNKSYYKRLRDAAGRLYNISFARDDEGRILLAKGNGDGLIEVGDSEFAGQRIFTSMKFSPREGGLNFRFSEEVKDEIHKLLIKGGFTLIQGKTLFSLSSMYSIRLIEMLLRFQNLEVNKRRGFILLKKDVDDLKFDLNISNLASYKNIAHLKQKILEPAKEDINDNTAYQLDYKDIKKGRKIIAFEFRLYYPPEDNNTAEEAAPTDELISDRAERRAREIDVTANVDNPDADIYDVLRFYGVTKIVAGRLAKDNPEGLIRDNIRCAIKYSQTHKVGNLAGLIRKAIEENKAAKIVESEQQSLFQPLIFEEQERPKYTSAERKKIDAEQYAADLHRMSDNLTKPLEEQAPIRPSTIKKLVDKDKNPQGLEYELEKIGMSREEIKALTLEELTARIEKGAAAPEEKPVEKIQDPEPETTPEPNIFDELESAPEAKAAAAEQRDLLAQFSEIELEMIKYSIKFGEPLDDELRAKVDASGAKLFHIYRLLNK